MNRRALLAVLVAAVLVRIGYVALLDPEILKLSDAFNFHVLGDAIRENRGYIVPSEWYVLKETRVTAEFGPVHPTFLAVANLLGLDTVRGQQYFMALVGSVTPVLTALLAWRLTRRQGVALAAGLVAAVNPMLFGADGSLMTETVFTLFATATIVLLCSCRDLGPSGAPIATRTVWRVAVAAGVTLGLAILTRGDGLLLVPLVVVPVLWRRWRELGVVVVTFLVVLAPWVVRNHARFDQVILSTNIGGLISGSNCEDTYEGRDLGGWNFYCAYDIELTGNEAVDANNLREKGIEYAKDHADRLPAVAAARIGRGWGVYRTVQVAYEEADFQGRIRTTQVIGVLATWVLLPLALAGAWVLRRRKVPMSPVLGPIVGVTVLFAVSYGLSRFGAVAHPAMVVGAVVAVAEVIDRKRRRSVEAV